MGCDPPVAAKKRRSLCGCVQFVGVVGHFAQSHELAQLGDVLPSISHQFSPLFAADHAVAM